MTKAALLDAVWAETSVSDTMPTICVGELRKVLGDQAKMPQFIETVHGRGYRFIAKVTTAIAGTTIKRQLPGPEPIMVGREEELAQLRGWFAKACAGARQVVFVSGEPGIGKTTFVRAFLDAIAQDGAARIGRGQCIEQYGSGEPYMPVLEALTRLGQEPEGERLREILRRVAPTWLAQMPSLVTAEDRARLQSETQGVTRQRMLREMTEAIEAMAADAPLILLLEDLHWSDFSTLELLAAIARRTEAARLTVLGTYRPVAMLVGEHPLRAMKEELELHQQCVDLRLKPLSEVNVADYLGLRFARGAAAQTFSGLAPAIHQRTEGNPLFMVNVVDYLVAQGSTLEASKIETPRGIRQMIERNFERLGADEQAILQSASVAGVGFSAAAVAAALERPVNEVETCCASLSRREQFLAAASDSSWPDGTVAASFRFQHVLYRDVLYERTPVGRRIELHQRIAAREETAYGARAGEIATELVYHYRRSGYKPKALQYLDLAGQRAVARRAYREAEGHYREALAVLETLPESPDRDAYELTLQIALGGVMIATRGYGATETNEAYTRARALAERSSGAESLQVSNIFDGLQAAAVSRGELRPALALADQMLEIARGLSSPAALVIAYYSRGLGRHYLGDLLGARADLVRATECYREEDFVGIANDRGMHSFIWAGINEWYCGYPDRALRYFEDVLSLARRLNNPFSLAFAAGLAAATYGLCGDFRRALETAQETVKLGTELGFPLFNATGKIQGAYARACMGATGSAASEIREGLAEMDAQNFYLARAWNLWVLSETQALVGSVDDALVTVGQALQTNPDELLYHTLALRLRGELRLQRDAGGKAQRELAEQDFRDAIDLSRGMSAKSLELRATTSLARLLAQQRRREEARTMLAEIYNWFTEGFDTADLMAAKALLDELNKRPERPRRSK